MDTIKIGNRLFPYREDSEKGIVFCEFEKFGHKQRIEAETIKDLKDQLDDYQRYDCYFPSYEYGDIQQVLKRYAKASRDYQQDSNSIFQISCDGSYNEFRENQFHRIAPKDIKGIQITVRGNHSTLLDVSEEDIISVRRIDRNEYEGTYYVFDRELKDTNKIPLIINL